MSSQLSRPIPRLRQKLPNGSPACEGHYNSLCRLSRRMIKGITTWYVVPLPCAGFGTGADLSARCRARHEMQTAARDADLSHRLRFLRLVLRLRVRRSLIHQTSQGHIARIAGVTLVALIALLTSRRSKSETLNPASHASAQPRNQSSASRSRVRHPARPPRELRAPRTPRAPRGYRRLSPMD